MASFAYNGSRLVSAAWPVLGDRYECESRALEQGALPMRVEIGYNVDSMGIGRLQWFFEPKRSRRYQVFITNPSLGVIGFRVLFPAHGTFAFNVHQPISVMVHYDDGERCWTSPALNIDPLRVARGHTLWVGWPPHP